MKNTVSKLQIAQAKECGQRVDRYAKGLETIISLCELIKPLAQYNKLPEDFKITHKKDMKAIILDLKAMKDDACALAENKWNRMKELEAKRDTQLNGGAK